ncbi:MAG: cation:proton antiporter [Clostridia bacterium]|nr:cation:proton antiporter [Clostridia bacterium]
MEILLTLSIALFLGLMLSRVVKLLQLPAVTAYLIAGVLIGPFVLGRFGVDGLGFVHGGISDVENFSVLSDVALGFIAFSIGNEFRLAQLKQIGKQATIIGIGQAVFTTIVVDAVLIGLHFIIPDQFPLPAAIIMGAVASATAPAATLMVVRQYKAKGPVTSTLLPVVALDDAVGLILFSISLGVAKAFASPEIDLVSIIVNPLLEVILSVGLGALMGMLFTFCERFFHSRSKRLAVSVAFVLATVALSKLSFHLGGSLHIGFSPLLACMMLGTVFCNTCDFSEELMDRLDRWTAPLFVLFFVISGAELDLSVFTNAIIVLIGVVYIISRCAGKYFGAFLSAKSVNCNPNIVKFLGITLWPQAGVALGMANIVKSDAALAAFKMPDGSFFNVGAIIVSLTLFSVLIYELVGPFLTKVALSKAGEIDPEGKKSARQRDGEIQPENISAPAPEAVATAPEATDPVLK